VFAGLLYAQQIRNNDQQTRAGNHRNFSRLMASALVNTALVYSQALFLGCAVEKLPYTVISGGAAS